MLENLGLFAKKYLFPIVITIVGIGLLILGLKIEPVSGEQQTTGFILGAVAVLIMGVVSLLYTLELIHRMVHLGIMVVLFAACGVLTFMSYNSLQDTIAKRNQKTKVDKHVKQGLSDVRDIQVAYKKVYGKYAPNFEELKRFLEEDKVFDVVKNGTPPDRRPTPEESAILGYDLIADENKIIDGIQEDEAVLLGFMTIDTVYYPVMEDLFTGVEAQKRNRAFPFEIGKLDIVPMNSTSEKFVLETLDVQEDSVTTHHYFLAYDPNPFDPFKKTDQSRDTLKIGSLVERSTSGNWGE